MSVPERAVELAKKYDSVTDFISKIVYGLAAIVVASASCWIAASQRDIQKAQAAIELRQADIQQRQMEIEQQPFVPRLKVRLNVNDKGRTDLVMVNEGGALYELEYETYAFLTLQETRVIGSEADKKRGGRPYESISVPVRGFLINVSERQDETHGELARVYGADLASFNKSFEAFDAAHAAVEEHMSEDVTLILKVSYRDQFDHRVTKFFDVGYVGQTEIPAAEAERRVEKFEDPSQVGNIPWIKELSAQDLQGLWASHAQ